MTAEAKPKKSTAGYFLDQVKRDAGRPGQAPYDGRHWIVMCLSVRQAIKAGMTRPRLYFRHTTEAAAIAEAERLAAANPGWRYGVFGSGPTYKVEAPAAAVVDAPEQVAA